MKKSEVVSLNGSQVYYEVYGQGEPLLLLHGYFGSSRSWFPYITDYATDYEVYLVDLMGHGKSGSFTEKFSLRKAANNLADLLSYLKLKNVHAIGISYGGDVLFQLALLHSELVKSMISIGACGSWDVNKYPDWLEKYSIKHIENLKWMREFQTDETQIKKILEQFPNYTVSLSAEELKSINAKTMIVLGDQDNSIPIECILNVQNHIPDFYLWILPNTGHIAHEGENKKMFVELSKRFFSENWKKP